MPFGFTMPPVASAAATKPLRLALVSNTTNDRREFELRAGEVITIGRASRTKGVELTAHSSNALFDCPVVSRIHAELRVSPPGEQVTITDLSSLHGTKVNGQPLTPGLKFQLHSTDVVKLGERVMRGDDNHEGVSLTFERIYTPPQASYVDEFNELKQLKSITFYPPPPHNRGFRAPSISDASDLDSGSYISDGEHEQEHHTSSAKTTPEQTKLKMQMKTGTQDAPITLDDGIPVDSDEDEEQEVSDLVELTTFSNRVPESDVRPLLTSTQHTDFDSFSDAGDAESVAPSDQEGDAGANIFGDEADSDLDDVDDVEYGDDLNEDDDDDEDDRSSSISDKSVAEEDSEDEEDSDADNDEYENGYMYREPSPELGSFTMTEPAIQPAAFADLASSAVWSNPATGRFESVRSNPTTGRFDPVRSAMAPVAEQAPEPAQPIARNPRNRYSYGAYPYPLEEELAVSDSALSNYWDQRPAHMNTAQSPRPVPQFLPQTPVNQQPPFAMSINNLVEPVPVFETNTAKDVDVVVPAAPTTVESVTKEIEALHEATDVLENTMKDIEHKYDTDLQNMFGSEAVSVKDNKRKRADADDDVAQPPTKKTTQTPPAPPAARRRLAPKKHGNAIRKVVVGAAQATAFAAVGCVGTIAFLSSPLSESLIQWLG